MRAKAKSSSTPYPIWVEGEYITEPPIRPSDGAIRPAGHYIDTVIALYCWKAKAENIIKIKKGYPEETKDISVDLNNINI